LKSICNIGRGNEIETARNTFCHFCSRSSVWLCCQISLFKNDFRTYFCFLIEIDIHFKDANLKYCINCFTWLPSFGRGEIIIKNGQMKSLCDMLKHV
jgi:hypothetical protein